MDKQSLATWYNRYMEACFAVTRRTNAEIMEAVHDDLTSDQYQILRYIVQKGRCTSTELSETFRVGKSSITAMITRLVDRGVLERTRDEADRRLVYLSLTEHGNSVFDQAELKVQELILSYLDHFDRQEVETFIATFEKLARLVSEGSKEV
ncbi:MarR family transcriptional regulator [Paenibacillus sp. CAA11]|uniref:MarR family winged helix-turn-helix transcriptional regulator n=1 Tax=Paenibacillus sp. CAA11 TaxID=1532905 RepID=UPI000D3C2896|nr:MarR family transcriptional regulator [Paenibacillus sp. CAA11]AWB44236.1 MarR family transcriptional regulator [Paenibacillus sp. CAA11]